MSNISLDCKHAFLTKMTNKPVDPVVSTQKSIESNDRRVKINAPYEKSLPPIHLPFSDHKNTHVFELRVVVNIFNEHRFWCTQFVPLRPLTTSLVHGISCERSETQFPAHFCAENSILIISVRFHRVSRDFLSFHKTILPTNNTTR